jgi:hypothetical protein
VVVESVVVVMGVAMGEETLVTVIAAVRIASQDAVQEPLYEAFSSRAVGVMASAVGTRGGLFLNGGFAHGTSLLGDVILHLTGLGVKTRDYS